MNAPQAIQSLPAIVLPALGATVKGGIYAGLSTAVDGTVYVLVRLPDEAPGKLNFDQSLDWAKSLDADLPTPAETALMHLTIPDHFEPHWYWTNKPVGSVCAMAQNFGTGLQDNFYRDGSLRAVAVRRLSPSDL